MSSALLVQINLHPKQKAFRESPAVFRGFVGGRGAGKSFIGAYDLLRRAKAGRLYMAIAPTYTMLKDASFRAFLQLAEQLRFVRDVNKGDLRVTLGNRAEVLFRSADEPERLRGPNLSGVWMDEASQMERAAYDIMIACLREGSEQGWLSATFTPRGRRHWTHEVFATGQPNTALFHARTMDNPFLPPEFAQVIGQQYTAFMARQELLGHFIDDAPGALWKRAQLDALRVVKHPDLKRVVIGVDPGVSSQEGAAETGIVAAGLGTDGHGYVLDDLSLRSSPDAWARQAVTAYYKHQADRIVGEVNNGGEMVGYTINTVDKKAAYKAVHASRGKYTRAEPVAALYEQSKVHHVGLFGELEDQMCSWVPGEKSPDHLDALVWALTDLLLGGEPATVQYHVHNPFYGRIMEVAHASRP